MIYLTLIIVAFIAFKLGQFWERGQWLGSEKRWNKYRWKP